MTYWKEWSATLTARVAAGVRARRTALGLSAADVAERTQVGKPLTRAVISDLETGRKKTLEVSELLTLAVALDIPPILLLFPDYPDGSVEVVPNVETSNEIAIDWVAGRGVLPGVESNAGTALVRAVTRRNELEDRRTLAEIDNELARQGVKGAATTDDGAIKRITTEINDMSTVVKLTNAKLWGHGDA